MSPITRKIILILFIIAFLTISPAILIYALGYQVNWNNFNLQKTGSLIIETNPKGAKIFIDDQPQTTFFKSFYSQDNSFITTPATLKNIAPGTYNIRLELEGYWTWTKQLAIQANQSTFLENVRLFANNDPLPIKYCDNQTTPKLYISPDGEYQVVVNNQNNKNQLFLLDTTNNQAKFLLESETPINYIAWSKNNKKILINNTLYNFKNNSLSEDFELNYRLQTPANQLRWGDNDQEMYYVNNQNKIYSFNINGQENNLIANLTQQVITDYLIKNGYLYTLSNDIIKQTSKLQIIKLSNQELISQLDLPLLSNYYFINQDNEFLNIYEPKKKNLYLLKTNLPIATDYHLETIASNLSQWTDDKLLYATDFEIWIWDQNSLQKTLLTRVSDRITAIFWHADDNYIIYSTANSIISLELDDRSRHSITTLVEMEKIDQPFLNQAGDLLIFYGLKGNDAAIYQLAI